MKAGHCRVIFVIAAIAFWPFPSLCNIIFTVCNYSSKTAFLALAGFEDDEIDHPKMTSHGWFQVEVGTCRQIKRPDLAAEHLFYRGDKEGQQDAWTNSKHRDGAWVAENYLFCAPKKAFDIVGDDNCDISDQKKFGLLAPTKLQGRTGYYKITLVD